MEYQLLPELSVEEYVALKASIAMSGILVPVEVDEQGNVLDGHHRIRAWNELRSEGAAVADYPRLVRGGMTEDQKVSHALTVNLARRHLTGEQRAELEIALRKLGWSYRRIAEKIGVEPSTVMRDVRATVANATVDLPERIVGADGKSRPATMPRREEEVEEEVEHRYKYGLAYCKYCYETHDSWTGFEGDAWLCELCDHATHDDFMQLGGQEEQYCANGIWHRFGADGKTVVLNAGTPLTTVFVASEKEQRKIAGAIATAPINGKVLTTAQVVSAQKEVEREAELHSQREAIEQALAATPPGLFHVIALDPPWPYGTEYSAEGRRVANPYPEMSLDQIASIALPAAEDCILWLWTTHRFMRCVFPLLDRWGFAEKMILTWEKSRMGTGSWLRSQSEFCIMAVKGHPKVLLSNETTVLHGDLREHSRKPEEFYALVDSLCPGRKIDYFSRESRPGWEQFGNDTDHF